MPTKVNADTRRREIVAKAAAVFDSRGYHATNLNMVASAVGLKKPTLYHYFASKDEILFSIHDEFIDLLIAEHESRRSSDVSAIESVRGVISDVLRLMETHRGHVRTFFEHYRELSPAQQGAIAEKRDRYATMVEAEIKRGISTGDFRELDPRLTTLALFGMCNWAYQWYRSGGSKSNEAIASFFGDLLLEGMTPRGGKRRT
jgi:TetR/AcrR family transcriptional regulator, cholesterol catabolism regulator